MSRKYVIISFIILLIFASWIFFLASGNNKYVKRNFYLNDSEIKCQTDYKLVRTLVPIIYQSVSSHFEAAPRNTIEVYNDIKFGGTTTLEGSKMYIKKDGKTLYKGSVIEDLSLYVDESGEYLIEIDEKIKDVKNMVKEEGYFKHECYINFIKY